MAGGMGTNNDVIVSVPTRGIFTPYVTALIIPSTYGLFKKETM